MKKPLKSYLFFLIVCLGYLALHLGLRLLLEFNPPSEPLGALRLLNGFGTAFQVLGFWGLLVLGLVVHFRNHLRWIFIIIGILIVVNALTTINFVMAYKKASPGDFEAILLFDLLFVISTVFLLLYGIIHQVIVSLLRRNQDPKV